jgi:hypothetical protein
MKIRQSQLQLGSGLATDWAPAEGVLSTVLGLRNWSETKRFMGALYCKWEQQERETERGVGGTRKELIVPQIQGQLFDNI